MGFVEDIERLNRLRQEGAISEQEYQDAKAALLAQSRPTGEKLKQAIDGIAPDDNMWGIFIHLSQFCGYLVPLAGLVVPIVLWQIKKDDSPVIDRHGIVVTNWILTAFILGVVFGLLCFVLIGIPLMAALVVVSVIFPVIGAIKARKGEVWRYPLSIGFFKFR